MSAKSMAAAIATRYKKTPQPARKRQAAPISNAITVTPRTNIAAVALPTTQASKKFTLDKMSTLNRFLILGTDAPAYISGRNSNVTVAMAKCVKDCIAVDGYATVDRIVEISKAGAAPKNEPALLALAMCATATDPAVRRYAMDKLPEVARIGTHLYAFAEFATSIRGWGRLMKEGVAAWYNDKSEADVAFQAVKYRQRNGWSHRDILRLAHPKADGDLRNNLYKWIVKGPEAIKQGDLMPEIVIAFEKMKTANLTQALNLITDHKLPWEAVPTDMLNQPAIWDALLSGMKTEAMVRNLGKMTSIGLLTGSSEATKKVIAALSDQNLITKSRYHPLKALIAGKTYGTGHGDKGSLTWSPVRPITQTLDDLFYRCFQAVTPTGKRRMICLDVSGSMGSAAIQGMPLTAREASAAMAMVTLKTEPLYHIMGFAADLRAIPITPQMNLPTVINTIAAIRFGATDCSLPMRYALANKLKVDSFEIYTDNETNYGGNPYKELERYRNEMGIDAKMVVVGMAVSKFSVANPADAGSLDVVGFDTAAPAVMADFVAGKF